MYQVLESNSHKYDVLKMITFKDLRKPCFQFVNKIKCSNIGSRLSVLKSLALGHKFVSTTLCFGYAKCNCWGVIKEPVDEINAIPVSPVPWHCKTRMIVYGLDRSSLM